MQDAGCRVQGAGCRVQGVRCRVQGAGCRVQGAGCRVKKVFALAQVLIKSFLDTLRLSCTHLILPGHTSRYSWTHVEVIGHTLQYLSLSLSNLYVSYKTFKCRVRDADVFALAQVLN